MLMHTPPLLIALREALHQAPIPAHSPLLECVNSRLKVPFFRLASLKAVETFIFKSSFASEINLFVGGSTGTKAPIRISFDAGIRR